MHPQPYPTRPHARAGSAPAGRHLDRVLSDLRLAADHGAQHILAVIVGLITGVLLIESYGAMVTAARAGGRPSPSCGRWAPRLWRWPWRCRCWRPSAWGIGPCCGCRGCCCAPRSRPVHLLQVAVAPPTLVGYLTAGATPVWLLGSFAVLSLLYRADLSADPATTAAEVSAEPAPASAAVASTSAPVSAGQLAAAAGLSASYARALVAQFQPNLTPTLTAVKRGRRAPLTPSHMPCQARPPRSQAPRGPGQPLIRSSEMRSGLRRRPM
jgi:hypothetical protein